MFATYMSVIEVPQGYKCNQWQSPVDEMFGRFSKGKMVMNVNKRMIRIRLWRLAPMV